MDVGGPRNPKLKSLVGESQGTPISIFLESLGHPYDFVLGIARALLSVSYWNPSGSPGAHDHTASECAALAWIVLLITISCCCVLLPLMHP